MPAMQDPTQGRISILNVGTKMLLKDSMDQFLRTLGDIKTHYASNMGAALRAFSENTIHILITEVDLGDGSAYRLIRDLGGAGVNDDLFVVMALEERNDAVMALANELETHSTLVKPFAANDLKSLVEKYKAWKAVPKDPCVLLVQEAYLNIRDKKFRDAENNFKDAINSAPTNPMPLIKAGLYFSGKPDFYGIAEGFFKKAISLKPDSVQAVSALGSLYLVKHEIDKAEDCLKKAHALSPLNPDRLVELVRLYIEKGVQLCKGSLRIDPSASLARYQLAKLLAVQKDYVGTVREFELTMPSLKDAQRTEAQTYVALARKLGGLAK